MYQDLPNDCTGSSVIWAFSTTLLILYANCMGYKASPLLNSNIHFTVFSNDFMNSEIIVTGLKKFKVLVVLPFGLLATGAIIVSLHIFGTLLLSKDILKTPHKAVLKSTLAISP